MVVGLAVYVSGFQKAVLDPILEAFSEWSNAVQLSVLTALVVIGVGVAAVVVRDRRRRLDAARVSIEGFVRDRMSDG